MTKKAWIILGSTVAALAVIAVIAVITLGGGEESTAAPGAPPQGFGQASEELQDCLAERGIDPGSGPPSGGAPDEGMQDAFQACQQYLPELPEGDQFSGAPPGGEGGFAPPSS